LLRYIKLPLLQKYVMIECAIVSVRLLRRKEVSFMSIDLAMRVEAIYLSITSISTHSGSNIHSALISSDYASFAFVSDKLKFLPTP